MAELDPELTIYALEDRPLTEDSPAYLAMEGSPIPPGLSYLLEVFLATDVLDTWSLWREGRAPTPEEGIAAIEWYADDDAYQPADDA
jgi:hypothetical protein